MPDKMLKIIDDEGKPHQVNERMLAELTKKEFQKEMAAIDLKSLPEEKRYEVVVESLNRAGLKALNALVPMAHFVTARIPEVVIKDISRSSPVGSLGRSDLTVKEKLKRFLYATMTGGLSTLYYVKKDKDKIEKELEVLEEES